MLKKFNRYLVFGGPILSMSLPGRGMDGVVCSTPDIGDALKYILKNNLGTTENWYQVFDCNTCQMVINSLESEFSTPRLLVEESPTHKLQGGALVKYIDDLGFKYKYKIDDTITFGDEDDVSANRVPINAVVKFVSNKNKKQLLVVDAGADVGKVELMVNDKYSINYATELDLLELM